MIKKNFCSFGTLNYDVLISFSCPYSGYQFARMQKNYGKMENFKEECAKFSKIGLLIAKNLGQGNYATDEWKERNEDFENWCKKQT